MSNIADPDQTPVGAVWPVNAVIGQAYLPNTLKVYGFEKVQTTAASATK